MAWVRYTAKRSLVGGVTNGQTITLELPLKYAGLQRSSSRTANTGVSLSGLRESYFYRNDISWSAITKPLGISLAAQMQQFLDSVADGQVFDFSPTLAQAFRNVTLTSDAYDGTVEAGLDTLTSYSFQMTEHP